MRINIKKFVGEFAPSRRFFDSELNDYVPIGARVFVSVAESLLQYVYKGRWRRWTSASHARAMMTGVFEKMVQPTAYYPLSLGPFAPAYASLASDEIDVDPSMVSDEEAEVPSMTWAESLFEEANLSVVCDVSFVPPARVVFSGVKILCRGNEKESETVRFAESENSRDVYHEWDGLLLVQKYPDFVGSSMVQTFEPDEEVSIIPFTDRSYLYDMRLIDADMTLAKQQIEVFGIYPSGNAAVVILQSDNQLRLRDIVNSGSAVNQNWAVQDLESDIVSGTDEVFKTAPCT